MDDHRQTNRRLETALPGGERTALHAPWRVLWISAMGFAMASGVVAAETTTNGSNSQSSIASPGLSQPQFLAPFVAPEDAQQAPVTIDLPSPTSPDAKAPYAADSVIVEDVPSKEAKQGRTSIWQMLFGNNAHSGSGNKVNRGVHSTARGAPNHNSGTKNTPNSVAQNIQAKTSTAPAPVAGSGGLAGSLFGQLAGKSQPSKPAVALPPNNAAAPKTDGMMSAVASLAAAGAPTTNSIQSKAIAAPQTPPAPATKPKGNASASAAAMQPEVLRAAIAPQTPPIAEGATKLWQQVTVGNIAPSPTSVVTQSAPAPNVGAAASNVPTASPAYSSAASAAAAQPGAVFAPIAKAVSGANIESNVSTGLWRSLAMNQNGAVPQQPPAANNTAAAAPQSTAVSQVAATSNQPVRTPNPTASPSTTLDAQQSSIWLQPFYLTNGTPPANNGDQSATGLATNSRQGDLETGMQSSSLFRQLSMSNGNEPPAAADGSPASPYSAEQVAYNKAGASGVLTDAALSAYMQDLEPVPADLDVKTGGEPAPAEAGSNDGAKKEEGALSGAEKLGKEPEDNTLEFLRAETVLLKPGESQFDIGLTYLITSNEFPILLANNQMVAGVDEVNFRSRQLVVPMEYRTGLMKRLQGFLGVPIGWANTQLEVNNTEGYFNDGGLGDVYFGLTAQLVEATPDCPYVIGTLSATAPTGGDPFTGLAAFATSAPALGQGFWSVQGQLLCIQEYDPCVVFYGGGIQGFFPHEYVGREFQRGMEYSYLFGIGFAVNERITLSSRFRGAYIDDLEVDGERILGSNLEPMTLRFAATISKPCKRLVEPFVEFGLTDEAVNSYFGITWTF